MYRYGKNVLTLLRCYLTHRTHRCRLQNTISDQRQIICGIPQGRILGPFRFIIYINDLPNCRKHTTPKFFADDTSLTAVGETVDEVEERANEDLVNVRRWLCAKKLSLNIAKTEYVLIGSRYKINKTDIQRQQSERSYGRIYKSENR